MLYYEVVGWLIVGAIGTAVIVELCYVIGMQIYEGKEIYKKIVAGIKKLYSILKPSRKRDDRRNKRRTRIKARAQRLRQIEVE